MSFHGRSPDDLPLAAYAPGAHPDDDDDEAVDLSADPGYTSVPASSMSTADMQHGHVGGSADPEAPATETEAMPKRVSLSFRLPFRLPTLSRAKTAGLRQAAPFQPVSSAAAPAGAFQAVTGAPSSTFQAAPAYPVTKPFEPASRPLAGRPPGAPPASKPRSKTGVKALRLPPRALRNPRVLAGGTVAIGLVLLGISLLGGGGFGGAGAPGSSQSTAVQPSAAPTGIANVEITSVPTGMYPLTAASGAGPAVNSQVNATWTDVLGNALGITGLASQGTRWTDPNFSLTWTTLIDGASVTFTSRAHECTVGMAVGATAVKGTFVCKKLTSDDGKHVMDLRGTYTT